MPPRHRLQGHAGSKVLGVIHLQRPAQGA